MYAQLEGKVPVQPQNPSQIAMQWELGRTKIA